jgi:hypothetical protein
MLHQRQELTIITTGIVINKLLSLTTPPRWSKPIPQQQQSIAHHQNSCHQQLLHDTTTTTTTTTPIDNLECIKRGWTCHIHVISNRFRIISMNIHMISIDIHMISTGSCRISMYLHVDFNDYFVELEWNPSQNVVDILGYHWIRGWIFAKIVEIRWKLRGTNTRNW